MQHNEVIKFLQERAAREWYTLANNRIDNKRLLDDYYSLLESE